MKPALVAVALLAASLASVPVGAQGTARLAVSAQAAPDSPFPGSTGSIQVSLSNLGDTAAYSLQARVTDVDPGIFINRTETIDLGALAAGASTTVSPWSFDVPRSTGAGVYRADFSLDYSYTKAGGGTEYGSLTFSATFNVQSNSALRIGPLTPDALAAGSRTTFSVKLHNAAPKAITSLSGTWTEATNTLAPTGQGNSFYVAQLDPAQDQTVTFEAAAPATAKPGLYPVHVHFTYNDESGSSQTAFNTFSVQVGANPAEKTLRLGPLAPDEILAGSHALLNLTVRNAGATAIKALSGSWTDPTGTLTALGQGNSFYVAELAGGASTTVPIEVSAPVGTKVGLYQLAMTLSYNDATGTAQQAASTFSLHVHGPPQLRVALDEWKQDSITIAISNTGRGPASSLAVSLATGGPVDVRPSYAVFVGTLEAGDRTRATFESTPPSGNAAPLKVRVSFLDADGALQNNTFTLDLGTPPSASGLSLTAYLGIAAGALVLAGILWVAARRRHKKSP